MLLLKVVFGALYILRLEECMLHAGEWCSIMLASFHSCPILKNSLDCQSHVERQGGCTSGRTTLTSPIPELAPVIMTVLPRTRLSFLKRVFQMKRKNQRPGRIVIRAMTPRGNRVTFKSRCTRVSIMAADLWCTDAAFMTGSRTTATSTPQIHDLA